MLNISSFFSLAVEQKRANQLRDVTAAIELETYTPAKTRILSVPPLPGTNESMLVSMMAATPIGETRAPVGTEGKLWFISTFD